jgi:hypothetical protein
MCISKNGGIAFNNRRQSRDEQVCKDIVTLADSNIFMNEYSTHLFRDIAGVQICDDCSKLADEYYFAEKEMPKVNENKISQIVLYHWNREYPADLFFDIDLKKFLLKETKEFTGKSHEHIRREIWERK